MLFFHSLTLIMHVHYLAKIKGKSLFFDPKKIEGLVIIAVFLLFSDRQKSLFSSYMTSEIYFQWSVKIEGQDFFWNQQKSTGLWFLWCFRTLMIDKNRYSLIWTRKYMSSGRSKQQKQDLFYLLPTTPIERPIIILVLP